MGVVYKARQKGLGRLVALKMVLVGGHAGPRELARFRSEAEAIARLQHPNIVQIYEVGEHEGRPFLSLEFCPGGSLEQELDGTPLRAREAAAVVERLARAMAAAHDQGVIHRDLKPANVLLAADGTLKITDFGLAKQVGATPQTASGAVLGTPSYMAPEQAGGQGKTVGPAADVYALGAILYELLTGRPPFKAATPLDTLVQVVHDEPVAVRQLQPKVPRDLETICHKCLEKEPPKRYPRAATLAEDLRRFRAGEPIQARPVGRVERLRKWARRRPALAALLLVTVLGMAGVVWKYRDAERQRRIAEEQTILAEERRTEAEKEAARAARARDFLVSMLRFSELEAAEKRIPTEFADQPELQAQLLAGIRRVKQIEAETTPQALILEVRGPVQLRSARNAGQPALPQTLLYSGDRLTLAADAQVQLVFLSDLHKERLQSAREATVRRKGCEPADVVTERTRDLLMTFVRLPKGTFYTGGGGGRAGKKTEIKEDFEMAVHTVTQGQWQAVMGTNPSWFSRQGNGRRSVLDISDEELKLFPVESVSWDDVQAFLNKLNEKERGSGFWYRLPTEAEWEYACRGRASSEEDCSYHFYFAKPANDLSSEQANFNGNLPFGNAPNGKYLARPTRVGAYPPNNLGLCDMHGNVWQWCDDRFAPEGLVRVARGGGWYISGSGCQAAFRYGFTRADRYDFLGFRLARVRVP
jgi:formylglycine-generating enzyme required for sulfatase activity